jgi:hypothetical protein
MDKEIRRVQNLIYSSEEYRSFKENLKKKYGDLIPYFFPIDMFEVVNILIENHKSNNEKYSVYLVTHEILELLLSNKIPYVMISNVKQLIIYSPMTMVNSIEEVCDITKEDIIGDIMYLHNKYHLPSDIIQRIIKYTK